MVATGQSAKKRQHYARTAVVLKFDETEAAGLSRVLVPHERHVLQLPKLAEVLPQPRLGRLPADAADKKLARGIPLAVAHDATPVAAVRRPIAAAAAAAAPGGSTPYDGPRHPPRAARHPRFAAEFQRTAVPGRR